MCSGELLQAAALHALLCQLLQLAAVAQASTLAIDRMAKPAASASMEAGMLRSGARRPSLANALAMLVAAKMSSSSVLLRGELSHDLATLASNRSCTAGCTAVLMVPAAPDESCKLVTSCAAAHGTGSKAVS